MTQLNFSFEDVKYNTANKAKNKFLGNNTTTHVTKFQLLPIFIHVLKAENAETNKYKSIHRTTNRFQQIFIVLPISLHAFRHVHPLVVLNRTFSKRTFSYVLMFAVCVDAKNHILVLV